MLKKMTGSCYKSMIRYGINYLDKHCEIVNDLNVFPVPDGDTGTNMVLTMKNGLQSLAGALEDLPGVAQSFANATVFGARGNSGVILSQFFKGMSEILKDVQEADCDVFAQALEKGCEYAYASVAKPVEGTILTVLRDATDATRSRLSHLKNIDELIEVFLKEAKESLDHTPELLPILKKAGVVDSGGSGLVYFFEGMQRYLRGDPMETPEVSHEPGSAFVDFTAFDRSSDFSYGYCTELLLQLTGEEDAFDYAAFTDRLEGMGDSLVISLEGDKVKLHVHTRTPEQILTYCHGFGEFLSLKIENMSVQHTQTSQKYLVSQNEATASFAIVAVAPNALLQEMISKMGADVVIKSEEVPSSNDFLGAFEQVQTKNILVFPNSSNSILSAMQAGSLYKKARVTVLNCRSIAQCYSALAMVDYEDEDINAVVNTVNDTIGNLCEVSVVHATKNIQYGNRTVVKNDYFALYGDEILITADKLEKAVLLTLKEILSQKDCNVVNLFYGQKVSEEQAEALAGEIEQIAPELEVCIIPTQNTVYDTVLSFE